MKKYIFLIICLFIVTGCDITYDLEIGKDNSLETTTMTEAYGNDSTLYDNYANSFIPLSKKISTDDLDYYDQNNVKSYEIIDISDDSNFGLKTNGKFNKNISIAESSIASFGAVNAIKEDDESITINVDKNLSLFRRYPTLNNLIVNIKVNNYKVISHNADKKKFNTYTWNFNRNNYNKKNIKLEISKQNIVERIFPKVVDSINGVPLLGLVGIGLLIIGIILYLKIKKKQIKQNEI